MSGSDDSDAEGGPVNMTRTVLRPPGHSGKAKRGHLCFDASFECGNLGRVDYISEFEYDLFIRPDTCNPRYRLWFNFIVDNAFTNQPVVFNLINLCKIKTLYRDGMTPLVKTTSRPRWQRLPLKFVYYHKSLEHRNHYVLTFAFAFDREEDVYQFAFCFPYSYTRCQEHLDLIEKRKFSYFRRDLIGYSLQNRKLDVITIGNPALLTAKKSKLIVVLARCHAGESPSSYVTQGIMDFMLSNHPIAATLREFVVIKIVPMINPDGVYLGNFRCSMMGYDLNRQWDQISPWTHPTLSALQNYFVELDSSKNFDLEMVIDIHAHSSLLGLFIHGNSYDDVYRFERHILFPKLLAHNAEDYNPNHTMYNRDPLKSGTARRHLCEILRNIVNVYTLEVSFLGYNHPVTNAVIAYDEDGYFRIGRNIVRTFLEYYRLTGHIPANAVPPPSSSSNKSAQQNQPAEKKGTTHKPKSRSRSRSVEKGEKAPSPVQSTEISNDEANKKVETSEDPQIDECTSDKAVLKLDKLTKEENLDYSNASSSDEDIDDGRVVKFKTEKDTKERISSRRASTVPKTPKPGASTDNPESPSTSPTRKPSRSNSSKKVPTTTKNSKIAFKTFDFSALHESIDSPSKEPEPESHFERRKQRFTRSSRSSTARKVGGGGILSKPTKPNVHNNSTQTSNKTGYDSTSDADTDPPCLTIIDFNSYLRNDVEGKFKGNEGRGWRGCPSGKTPTQKVQLDHTYAWKLRRRQLRRRRELIVRGSVTDCSPWEDDSSSDSESPVLCPITRKIDSFKEKQIRCKSSKASLSS